jgi:hypothetical protein
LKLKCVKSITKSCRSLEILVLRPTVFYKQLDLTLHPGCISNPDPKYWLNYHNFYCYHVFCAVAYMLDTSRVNARTIAMLQEVNVFSLTSCTALRSLKSIIIVIDLNPLIFQFIAYFPQGQPLLQDTRKFGNALIRALVTPHILRRLQRHGIQTYIKMKAHVYLGSLDYIN